MKFFRKNKKGFTLTELMVVVAILGILVAIAVPVYNNVTATAIANADDANIRTIKSALLQMQVDGKCVASEVIIEPIIAGGAVTGLSATSTLDGTVEADSPANITVILGIIADYIEWPLQPQSETLSYDVAVNNVVTKQ